MWNESTTFFLPWKSLNVIGAPSFAGKVKFGPIAPISVNVSLPLSIH
jgi:hypothetical protein